MLHCDPFLTLCPKIEMGVGVQLRLIVYQTKPLLHILSSRYELCLNLHSHNVQVPVREGLFEDMFVDDGVTEETQSESPVSQTHCDASVGSQLSAHEPT